MDRPTFTAPGRLASARSRGRRATTRVPLGPTVDAPRRPSDNGLRLPEEERVVLEPHGQLRRDMLLRAHVPVQPVVRPRRHLRLLSRDARLQHPRGRDRGHRHRRPEGGGHRRHAEGHDRGELAPRCVRRRRRQRRADRKLVQVFSGQLGGPMGALAPLVGEILGVERAAIDVDDDGFRHSVRIGDAIDFEIEDIVPFGSKPDSPFASTACSIPSARTSPWPRPSARGSMRSASSTRARPGSRSPSSPGPPEPWSRRRTERVAGGGGLAPAFAAARTRLGLVALLFAARRGRLVVDGRPDAGHGRGSLDRPWSASAGSSACGW